MDDNFLTNMQATGGLLSQDSNEQDIVPDFDDSVFGVDFTKNSVSEEDYQDLLGSDTGPITGIPVPRENDITLCLEDLFNCLQTNEEPTTKERAKKVCHICQKRVHQLHKHILIHEGKKRHVCSQCQRAFVQKSNLNRHVRTVHRLNGEPQRFACPQCMFKTNRIDKLKGHFKKHSSM